jgi:c-di-GMP-binding flagellar brake protein YcgR
MQTERRKFERHLITFQLEIRGDSQDGSVFCEKTQLIDISGGGAVFRSLLPDSYYEGQIVQADIIIPGTPDLTAQMKTRATVIRLHKDNNQHMNVSVHFLKPFTLLRAEKL